MPDATVSQTVKGGKIVSSATAIDSPDLSGLADLRSSCEISHSNSLFKATASHLVEKDQFFRSSHLGMDFCLMQQI